MKTEEQPTTGTALFKSLHNIVPSKFLALTVNEWSPTPFMVDAYVGDDRRAENIRRWCWHQFGPESSPVHKKAGVWRQSSVTIKGYSWFGFATESLMQQFVAKFPSP